MKHSANMLDDARRLLLSGDYSDALDVCRLESNAERSAAERTALLGVEVQALCELDRLEEAQRVAESALTTDVQTGKLGLAWHRPEAVRCCLSVLVSGGAAKRACERMAAAWPQLQRDYIAMEWSREQVSALVLDVWIEGLLLGDALPGDDATRRHEWGIAHLDQVKRVLASAAEWLSEQRLAEMQRRVMHLQRDIERDTTDTHSTADGEATPASTATRHSPVSALMQRLRHDPDMAADVLAYATAGLVGAFLLYRYWRRHRPSSELSLRDTLWARLRRNRVIRSAAQLTASAFNLSNL
ncbi:hypothetical protein CDCA_CDCA07G2220 [Cyanidium caldarium]|uniref:Uncharacterized protein n=1 Tax=Cyanidium caldarium TaxID=2771 RepID=A0AAV9IV58_CYACA|nr:hypothetical protein CDCA_CDCA07G2220 [Cyanidium caldarium]